MLVMLPLATFLVCHFVARAVLETEHSVRSPVNIRFLFLVITSQRYDNFLDYTKKQAKIL